MAIDDSAANVREVPVIFPVGRDEIYGILTEPPAPSEATVVLLKGAGFAPMTHRNRMWVRLARRLAAEGLSVLRFDYHGVGESTGHVTRSRFNLDRPFADDLHGALRWLRSAKNPQGVILVGTCFGARTILACADRVPDLRGAVLLSLPIWSRGEFSASRTPEKTSLRSYLRRATQPGALRDLLQRDLLGIPGRIVKSSLRRVATRLSRLLGRQPLRRAQDLASPTVLRQIRQLVQRRIPLVFLYGSAEDYYEEFQRALNGALGRVLDEGKATTRVFTAEGIMHSFQSVAVQEASVELTVTAIRSMRGGSVSVPSAQTRR